MNLHFVLILLGCGVVAGCMPYDDSDLYAPGGALADTNSGSMVLASATDSSVAAMFPKGMAKSQVVQILGQPDSQTNSSNGLSQQIFMHHFISPMKQNLATEVLSVEYDKNDKITKTDFSQTKTKW
jgi:outer membrane protein assembly factor BamE (lipoprotein component of BamABCDE complex)